MKGFNRIGSKEFFSSRSNHAKISKLYTQVYADEFGIITDWLNNETNEVEFRMVVSGLGINEYYSR